MYFKKLTKVNKLISEAVEEDISGNLNKAYKLYCEGLQYYIPIISNERDIDRKNHFRELANEYMRRAEEIKILLKSSSSNMRDIRLVKPVQHTNSVTSTSRNENVVLKYIEPSAIFNELCMCFINN